MIKHRNFIGLAVALAVVIGAVSWVNLRSEKPAVIEKQPVQPSNKTPAKPLTTSFGIDKTLYSIKEADSIWTIVNKGRVLQDGFQPPALIVPNVKLRLTPTDDQMHVRSTTASAMEKMFTAAATNNVNLMLASGFRSQEYQRSLYATYVAQQGVAGADRSSARPGHSEHQTGLAFDIEPANKKCELDACFGDTVEGKWVSAHAAEYGFIVRYGKDQEQLTGYEYEPWHLRYVGKDLAKVLYEKHLTMEQFFGLQPSLSYN
jgi:D-alanyl-D-alanine carboxypeptidase